VEQDDAKIAEKWWSGTAGSQTGDAGAGADPKLESSTDWESLRQKFVLTHDSQTAGKRAHSTRGFRTLMFLFGILGVIVAGASLLVLAGDSVVPERVRDSLSALLDQPPVAVAPTEEQPPAGVSRKKSRARRGNAQGDVFRESRPRVEATAREASPFIIEVIDGNRRTVVRAYDDPVLLAVDQPQPVTVTSPEVPTLVIEETIGAGGTVSTTTNVGASVVLSGIVTPDGHMRDLRVVRGPAEFVPAAMEAIRRWRFTVKRDDGVAVERPARVTVNLAIKADGAPSPAK
jgi:hypothetical protein